MPRPRIPYGEKMSLSTMKNRKREDGYIREFANTGKVNIYVDGRFYTLIRYRSSVERTRKVNGVIKVIMRLRKVHRIYYDIVTHQANHKLLNDQEQWQRT